MYHFRRSGEQVKFDKHQAYLKQAHSELQEILKWDSTGKLDQTAEGTERAHWIQHIKEMISVLTCMVPWLAEPENKKLSMDYSEKLKTLLVEFEGEGYPTRKNIEEVKSISKWYQRFLATPTEMVAPPGARTFSEEEDPAHEDVGGNSSQNSPSTPQESKDEDPAETPRPSSGGEDIEDPEGDDTGFNQRRGKSKNRIDSDSDGSTSKNSGGKDIKVVREFKMTLRGQKDFEELSLRTDNPRKRLREDMESTPSQLKERPTQTPQGEKILYARLWTPVYFMKSGARQTPSYPVEFTKKCDGKMKRFRSEGVEGQYKKRVTRRPQKFKPVDMEPWKMVAKVTLNFRLPAKTARNVTWTTPKDGQGKGQCRFRPSSLALSEVKHFMGVATADRPHATIGTGEYVSQRMTFLYSPRLGNWSSRLVTKLTAMISKAWQPSGTSNLDRMIAPLRMWVDTVSYLRTCVVRPPEMTLYKEAYWP